MNAVGYVVVVFIAIFLLIGAIVGFPVVLPFLFDENAKQSVAYTVCMDRFYMSEQRAISDTMRRGNAPPDANVIHPARIQAAEKACVEEAKRRIESGEAER